MKSLYAILLSVILVPSLLFADLPEGHWLSERIDTERKVLVVYENWFETNEAGGRVYRSKMVKETALTEEISEKPPGVPPVHPHPVPVTAWYCFAHDYVDGHSKTDPKDESCIQAHYKGEADTWERAAERALRRCATHSKNKATCEMWSHRNCLPETKRAGAIL